MALILSGGVGQLAEAVGVIPRRLRRPEKEHVQHDIVEIDVHQMVDAEYKRAHYIGRLFQDPMLGTAPDLTVYENLMLAAKQGSWLSIPDKNDKAYLKERLKELDMGLEDRMNAPVRLLSGGQRQALTLIMATINPPKILLLDEHTAALDPESADKVIALTEKIVSENRITCLMITHNMNQALQTGNRTIMLNNGRIVFASGTSNLSAASASYDIFRQM